MVDGQETLLEDLEEIYKRETKRITGIEGVLTAPEAHDLSAVIEHLSRNNRTVPPWWESTVENLRRSLPPGWVVAAGANVYRYIGPVAMLALMGAVYGALGGKQVQHATLVVAGLAVVSCCYLIPNFLYWRTVVKARRRLAELDTMPDAPAGPAQQPSVPSA
jgi:hypothetical protein